MIDVEISVFPFKRSYLTLFFHIKWKSEKMSEKAKKHAFSVELESKEYVKLITIANDSRNRVLIEGFLGKILDLNFVENSLLEIKGYNGILRIDLQIEDLTQLRKKLLAYESHASRAYFQRIFSLFPESVRPEGRRTFKAYDGVNNLFNLGYELLSWKAQVWR